MQDDGLNDPSVPGDINPFSKVPKHAMTLFTSKMSMDSLSAFRQIEPKAEYAFQLEFQYYHDLNFFCRLFDISEFEANQVFIDLHYVSNHQFKVQDKLETLISDYEKNIRENDQYTICRNFFAKLYIKSKNNRNSESDLFARPVRTNAVYGRGHTGWLDNKQAAVFLTLLSLYCTDLCDQQIVLLAKNCVVRSEHNPKDVVYLINTFYECVKQLQSEIPATLPRSLSASL